MKRTSVLLLFTITLFVAGCSDQGSKSTDAHDHSTHQHGTVAEAASSSGETVKAYICPMDQYTSNKAGDCPLCGMKLEEREMSAAEAKAAIARSQTA